MIDNAEYYAKELEWVAGRLRDGRAGEHEIADLVNVIRVIRAATPPTSPEGEVIRQYTEAKEAETIAAGAVSAYFKPIIKNAETESEANDILLRMPSIVEKSFAIDYFVNVSKILPRRA